MPGPVAKEVGVGTGVTGAGHVGQTIAQVGVAVGVGDLVPVTVGWTVGVSVAVGIAVKVWVGIGVQVCISVAVGVGVSVGTGIVYLVGVDATSAKALGASAHGMRAAPHRQAISTAAVSVSANLGSMLFSNG